DIGGYGRTMFNRISGFAVSTHETAFDTHHGSYGNKFIGCEVDGVNLSGSRAYGLRGRRHELVNCSAHNVSIGFAFFDEGAATKPWAYTGNHKMIGCVATRAYQPISADLGRYWDADLGPTVEIHGGSFESYGSSFVFGRNARFVFGDPFFRSDVDQPVATNGRILTFAQCDVLGSMRVDLARWTVGAVSALLYFANAGTERSFVDLDLRAVISEFGRANLAYLTEWNTQIGDVRLYINGSTTAAFTRNTGLEAGLQRLTVRGRAEIGPGGNSNVNVVTVTAGTAIPTLRSGDPIIFNRLTAASNVTSGTLGPGMLGGQMMKIHVASDSPGTVTIPNGSAYLTNIGANTPIAPGQTLTLMWDSVVKLWVKG
ncbi:hypothetical protein, partial [Microbacterium sp. KNMS]